MVAGSQHKILTVMHVYLPMMLLIIFLGACTSINEKYQENQVIHIVLIWLKQPGNTDHTNQIVQVTHELIEIPEVKELYVGRSIPSDRKIVDDSFDIGISMHFNNQEEMQRYLVHPKHKQAVHEVLKPLAAKVLVYDLSDFMEN